MGQDRPVETTIATERVYTGRVINLRVDTVALAGGQTYRREIVEHRGAVAIVAIDDHGSVLLVRQFRKAAGRVLLELPAGTLEIGEDPLRCAARELEEETGFKAKQFDFLAAFYTSPGFSTELLHVFLAQGLEPGTPATEEDEHIELERLRLAAAIGLIGSGEILDAKTVAGLLLARDRLGSA